MKLNHYITCNIGRGTITILNIEDDNGKDMLRISPNAKSNKVVRVKSSEMQAALDKERLLDVEHNINKEIAAQIEFAILQWMTSEKINTGSIRWEKNNAKFFRTSTEAKEWDASRESAETEALTSAAPRKKRFMLG